MTFGMYLGDEHDHVNINLICGTIFSLVVDGIVILVGLLSR